MGHVASQAFFPFILIFYSGESVIMKDFGVQGVTKINLPFFRLSGLREAQRILDRLEHKNRLALQIRKQLQEVKY